MTDRTWADSTTIQEDISVGGTVKHNVVSVPASALPAPTGSTLGGVKSLAAAATLFLTGIGTDGVPTRAQPAYTDISGLSTVAHTGAYGDLSGTPSLATVATSGLYSDLSGKPTLGSLAALSTVNNSNWSGTALSNANGGIGKVALTQPATGSTLTILDGKTLTINNSITLAGTDAQTYTFPVASDTVACLGTAQAFSAAQTFNANVTLGSAQQLLWSTDLKISRIAAATFGFGGGDAAAPVAQIFQVPGVLGGTSNTAGSDWTDIASLSTGTGIAGNRILQTGFKGVTQSAVSVTCTSASPGVVTLAAHGFVPGQSFQFGGSAAPTGTSLATTYYVSATGLATGTFQFSATPGGASINTSSTGTSLTLTTGASTQNPASTVATWGPSGLTGSQTTSALSITQTLNTSGAAAVLKVNANVISANNALLFDFQNAGSSKFKMDVFAGASFGAGVLYMNGVGGGMRLDYNGILASKGDTGQIGFSPSTNVAVAPDTLFTRAGVAVMQLGSQDAAAPVAQTLQVQNVVAGTTNTAGTDWTLKASKGTGTGAGGQFVFQTAPAGSTGTAQNALATGLTLTAPAVNMQPSVVVGNQALATNATDGFLYITTGAGAPSGVPTTFTGRVPMYFDTTNLFLYFYTGGAWKKSTIYA